MTDHVSKKVNDDIRILAGLRAGRVVYSELDMYWGHGTWFYHIDAPQGAVGTYLSRRSIAAALDSGLIAKGPHTDGPRKRSRHYYSLTDAGRQAAAALPEMTINEIVVRPPKRVLTPEQREAAEHKRIAQKVVRTLRDFDGRIRDGQMMRAATFHSLMKSYCHSLRDPLPQATMDLIEPWLEKFTDIDGAESLRLSAEGLAATESSNFKFPVTKVGK